MTTEQKAKAYDEAVNKLRRFMTQGVDPLITRADVQDFFPELAEPENEKIRKSIYIYLDWLDGRKDYAPRGEYTIRDMISWLEKQGQTFTKKDVDDAYLRGVSDAKHELGKQGEQKPADKVEPKFKVGDWITNGDYTWKIVEIKPLDYILQSQDGNIVDDTIYHVDEQFHSFTIEDAKDGDVLLFEGYYNSIVLFQGIGINGKGRINYHCKCDLGNYSFGVQGDVACLGTIEKDAEHYHPATKEHRKLLFKKMHEARYKWDAEKKELKKIEQQPAAWSEEDDVRFESCIKMLQTLDGYDTINVKWLKSLRGRVQPQPQQKWSEKDETKIKSIIAFLKSPSLCAMENNKDIIDENIKYLKSLKDRYTWKPSEEQMQALQKSIGIVGELTIKGEYLEELFEDLKKLREDKL